MMKIIVSGATGLIGGELYRRLTQDGHEPTVLSRDPVAAARTLGFPVVCSAWNGHEIAPSLFDGIDAVVHLAGHPVAAGRWTERVKKLIHDSRVDGTRAIVGAMQHAKSGAPKVLVCASATGYYGDRGEEVLAENSPPGNDFLAHVCSDWESAAVQAAYSDVRVVSLRFGMVLGHGGALAKMLPPFKLGFGGRIGNGRQWMSWIHVADAAGLIATALEDAGLSGPVNAVSPEPARNVDFTRALGTALHRPTFFPVPATALKIMFGEMAGVLLASQRVEPRRAFNAGYRFQHPGLAEALEDLMPRAYAKHPNGKRT